VGHENDPLLPPAAFSSHAWDLLPGESYDIRHSYSLLCHPAPDNSYFVVLRQPIAAASNLTDRLRRQVHFDGQDGLSPIIALDLQGPDRTLSFGARFRIGCNAVTHSTTFFQKLDIIEQFGDRPAPQVAQVVASLHVLEFPDPAPRPCQRQPLRLLAQLLVPFFNQTKQGTQGAPLQRKVRLRRLLLHDDASNEHFLNLKSLVIKEIHDWTDLIEFHRRMSCEKTQSSHPEVILFADLAQTSSSDNLGKLLASTQTSDLPPTQRCQDRIVIGCLEKPVSHCLGQQKRNVQTPNAYAEAEFFIPFMLNQLFARGKPEPCRGHEDGNRVLGKKMLG